MTENIQYSTDRESYNKADSGCPKATRQLGLPSHCSECPFKKCFGDKRIPVFGDLIQAKLAMFMAYSDYNQGFKIPVRNKI